VTKVAILAGGASKRMGEDKALLRIVPDGPTMLERVTRVARQIADEVMVICPEDRAYSGFGARIVVDEHPGEGPLGGIISALRASTCPQTLVLSCDLPFLSVPLIRWMCELPETPLLIPEIEGRGHPLLARYGANVLSALTRQFDAGERRLQSALIGLQTRIVTERDVLRFDPSLRSFFNANSPEELAVVKKWLQDQREVANRSNGAIY
jgi:molybdopterin-guanine dinucleotide biosynthesis protein A